MSSLIEEAVLIHRENIVIDGHCDSLLHSVRRPYARDFKPRDLSSRSSVGHADIPRLKEAGVDCQFFSVFVEPFYKPEKSLKRALELVDAYYRLVEKGSVKPVLRGDDVLEAHTRNVVGGLLLLEGGEAVSGSLGVLRMLYRMGVRAMSLTWNNRNDLADGVLDARTGGGISMLGVQVLEEMARLGMILDVSHLSDAGFWDVIDLFKGPIIASHSSCRALCDTLRNLSDEQIRALADRDGVIGINFSPGFIKTEGRATAEDVAAHVLHVVEVAGIDHVGYGSDFDGTSSTPEGLEDVTKLPCLTAKLLEAGLSEKEIRKVIGGNLLRVINKLQ